MDIDQIITRREYDSLRSVSYDQFCDYIKRIVKLSVEESLRTLPFVLNHLASQAAYLKEKSDKFYADNKDLAGHRRIVAQEIEKAEAENPGKDYDAVLEIAAGRARRIIASMDKVTDFNPKELGRFDSHLRKL